MSVAPHRSVVSTAAASGSIVIGLPLSWTSDILPRFGGWHLSRSEASALATAIGGSGRLPRFGGRHLFTPASHCNRAATAGRWQPWPAGSHGHDPSGRGGGIRAFSQASLPEGTTPKENRQRPYRRRSSNPSPPKSSPNTALKPLGSISGTPEGPLTGLASR